MCFVLEEMAALGEAAGIIVMPASGVGGLRSTLFDACLPVRKALACFTDLFSPHRGIGAGARAPLRLTGAPRFPAISAP